MTRYLKVTIPRPDGFRAANRGAYHFLLQDRIYPLVDELRRQSLIEGYDFLSHTGIDLRLWVPESVEPSQIQAHLRQRGLPDQLVDYAPSETGLDREILLDLLHRSAEQLRTLLEDQGQRHHLEEVVHWLLNQYGLHNRHEIRFHLACASSWMPPQATGGLAVRLLTWLRKLHLGQMLILSAPAVMVGWLLLVVLGVYLFSLEGCPGSAWECKIPSFWVEFGLWTLAFVAVAVAFIAGWWTWFGARRKPQPW